MRYNRATSALRLAAKFRGREGPFLVPPRKPGELRLLVPWGNPLRVFAGNLVDWFCGRTVPKAPIAFAPDHSFWRDIELRTVWPRRGMFDSALTHTALLGLLYAISIWPDSKPHLTSPLSAHRVSINSYTLSPYLPELHGPPAPSKARANPDPVRAEQEILSLPDAPDNLRQTVVAPPPVRLQQDLQLPNIVVLRFVPPIQPLAASAQVSGSRLPMLLTPNVVAPEPDTSSLSSKTRLPSFQPQVIAPAPDLAEATPRLVLPLSRPNVAGPTPDVGSLSQSGAPTSLAGLTPAVPNLVSGIPQVTGVSPAPVQFIALNLRPADVHAPVELPAGNRRGAFAVSPSGQPNATGTPGSQSPPSTRSYNAPAGIRVSGPEVPSASGAMPNAPAPAAGDSNLLAMAAAAHSIPRRRPIARENTAPRNALENRVFAGRRSYTLSVNMPNLNAATGSWIIHFAERHPASGHIPISAPEVLSKFDPAYPGELMQDGVQGVVILTAVIRADGSVANIAVAQSLNPLLDHNAAAAFSRWLFRPAMRNGEAIDLEAVITVPFRAKTAGF